MDKLKGVYEGSKHVGVRALRGRQKAGWVARGVIDKR